MQKKEMTTEAALVRYITKLFTLAIDIGMVWLAAWYFNPDFTTGTVWFIAVLYAIGLSCIYNVRNPIE